MRKDYEDVGLRTRRKKLLIQISMTALAVVTLALVIAALTSAA